jgi:hypothetical protein
MRGIGQNKRKKVCTFNLDEMSKLNPFFHLRITKKEGLMEIIDHLEQQIVRNVVIIILF